ncbi:MAG: HEPN domain-containing protein [Myxococcales bacterium]|nr:HEPN domain-containing protein [Myxococcales bacterium]
MERSCADRLFDSLGTRASPARKTAAAGCRPGGGSIVTGDNRRQNIAIDVARGNDSLESAEILLAAGKLADPVSRAYYAAFHHACALLLIHGEQARRHGGVERLLQRDLVRTGALEPEIARLSRI